jgi:hypothetical protein
MRGFDILMAPGRSVAVGRMLPHVRGVFNGGHALFTTQRPRVPSGIITEF